jgi:hypothetical protein
MPNPSKVTGVDRATMEKALRNECVPALRRSGFKGAFPNFYRDSDGFVALVNFQFYSSGGSFCVNISYADAGRSNIYFRPETKVSKLKVSQARDCLRLGAASERSDKWFSFGETSYGHHRGEVIPVLELVATVTSLLQSQAEDWWRTKRGLGVV